MHQVIGLNILSVFILSFNKKNIIQVTPVLKDNKILAQGEGGDYSLLMEMTADGKLKETINFSGYCMSRISKKI